MCLSPFATNDSFAAMAMNKMESMKEKAAADHHEEEAAPMKAVQRSSMKAMKMMTTTSKEGSRRANYPILTQGGSDKKYQYEALLSCNWNEHNSKSCSSIDWRASLVPAAAVIPAPIAYIKVVAVKKLVVGVLPGAACPPQW